LPFSGAASRNQRANEQAYRSSGPCFPRFASWHERDTRKTRVEARRQRLLALLFFIPITLPGLFLGLALLVFFARLGIQLSLVTVVLGHLLYVLFLTVGRRRPVLER
jgi:hypothetical protein